MAEYTTRFDLGQEVWAISQARKSRSDVCTVCNGTGRIDVANFPQGTFCPVSECRRGRVNIEWFDEWEILCGAAHVGRITVTAYVASYVASYESNGATYMLDATGVGSGTVWDEDKLFATESEANAECARRNALLPVPPTPGARD